LIPLLLVQRSYEAVNTANAEVADDAMLIRTILKP